MSSPPSSEKQTQQSYTPAQDRGETADSDSGGVLDLTRRDILAGICLAGTMVGIDRADQLTQADAEAADTDVPDVDAAALKANTIAPTALDEAKALREDRAAVVAGQSLPEHPVVADDSETIAANGFRGRFTKGLQHNADLTVDVETYATYLAAIRDNTPEAWANVDGGPREFIDPVAGTTTPLLGMDPHEHALDSPPAQDSDVTAAEMVECYWQSLLRDVPFSQYSDTGLPQTAADDLSQFDALPAPRENGRITGETLFRGTLPGSTTGPFLSQFLLQPTPYGAHRIDQEIRINEPGRDYLTDPEVFLGNMNGERPAAEQTFADEPRYITTLRDLASCVQRDVTPGQFLLAALFLIDRPVDGVPADKTDELYDQNNPYRDPSNRGAHGFVNYARPAFLDLITRAARQGMIAAWFNKWRVHRRARPEKTGGLIHQTFVGEHDHSDVLHGSLDDTIVFDRIQNSHGSALLPQAYPEGAPTHPSYPGGHATAAAAAGTAVKALFNDQYVIEDPVVPSADGSELLPYEGPAAEQLTVEHEINKLIDNINIGGRQGAGVHYRTDSLAGYQLGEQVAMRLLSDVREQTPEGAGFEFTSFSGDRVSI